MFQSDTYNYPKNKQKILISTYLKSYIYEQNINYLQIVQDL